LAPLSELNSESDIPEPVVTVPTGFPPFERRDITARSTIGIPSAVIQFGRPDPVQGAQMEPRINLA
jgi:hypothetical protein